MTGVESRIEGDDVIVTATLASDVETTIRAMTEPPLLAKWIWPESLGADVKTDVRVGGSYAMRATSGLPPDMPLAVSGTYMLVDLPHRVEATWQWVDDEHVSHVVYEFASAATGSVVTITHSQNGSPEQIQNHLDGWNDCLARLVTWSEAHPA